MADQVLLMEHLQRLKHLQLTAIHRKGQAPQLAQSSQEVLQLRWSIRASAAQFAHVVSMVASSTKILLQQSICHNIDVSKNPLKNLKKTTLRHLRLEEATKGGYLILRTLETAYKNVGITTVVEDEEGSGVLFSTYNFTADRNPDLNDILPVGTVFILKEPYIKIAASMESMVRCDCPSDMIVLYKGHDLFGLTERIVWKNYIDPSVCKDLVWSNPKPKTASEWKKRGNELFKQKKFEFASRCYLLGLNKLVEMGDDGPLVQVLRSNLSAAYLQMECFEKSLEFAEKVMIVEPANRKALLRAGKSSYRLRKYEDAKKYFEKCHSLYPDDEETNIELQKAKDRCFEQETGEFDMYRMFLFEILHPRQKLDCADYVGPIKIVAIEGKGRGVVATRDLEPGTLLVVSKSIVFAWKPENKVHVQVNSDQTIDMENSSEVVAELAQLITKNPNVFGTIVYDLFDGKEQVNKKSVPLFCDPDTKQEPIVDVQRLKDTLTTNVFGSVPNTFSSKCNDRPEMFSEKHHNEICGSGLFAVPSYFNHSCLPNAIYLTFNDVMFVRTINFIKAEEEIFVPYFDPHLPYSKRQNLCEKRGFQCSCALCMQDRQLPKSVHCKRESIISKFDKLFSQCIKEPPIGNSNLVQRQLKNLIRELNATYDSSKPCLLKSMLSSMYRLLSDVSLYIKFKGAGGGHFNREIVWVHKILTLHGFDPTGLLEALEKGERLITQNAFLDSNVFVAIFHLICIYHKTSQVELKTKWLQILCSLEKIYSGGDINVIKLKYKVLKNVC